MFLKLDKTKTISDPQLGEIVFRKNAKAKSYIIRWKNGKLSVTIPMYGNFTRAKEFLLENKQKLLRKIHQQRTDQLPPDIDEVALRKKAQSLLPARLASLAESHGFKYTNVKIRKNKTRWGSCSSKGTINLSIYLMLLPDHLIEYVLLHELCHTVQMNHSPAFWALLNQCTQNRACDLRKEIRKCSITYIPI